MAIRLTSKLLLVDYGIRGRRCLPSTIMAAYTTRAHKAFCTQKTSPKAGRIKRQKIKEAKMITYYEYLESDLWSKLRAKVKKRDKRRCRLCNSSGNLHVHHRKYPEVYGQEPLEDLITICEKCHGLFHKKA